MPQPAPRATLVFMHHLGGSAQTWKPVEEKLLEHFNCVRLDLPGFGDAAGQHGLPVAGMADWIERSVSGRVSGPWVLVGHSMSAKIALLIARRAEDGKAIAPGLAGLVLAAGSPPSPEPMQQEKRQEMLGWFAGDANRSRQEADGYVQGNVSAALDGPLHQDAVRDVLRSSRHAWNAWLQQGSLEDLREVVGTLAMPALVLAGADDEALGKDVQRERMLPHLLSARLEIVPAAAHLLPMEQPGLVAGLIGDFVDGLESDARMTRRTESLLEARGQPDDDYRPQVLDMAGMAVLRRLLASLLPMPDGMHIDLAAKLDARLAEAVGDGWRFAALPPDAACWQQAVATLDSASLRVHGKDFAALDDPACAAILQQAASGTLDATRTGAGGTRDDTPLLPAASMKLWLQEVRGDACQIFLTHPAVQARAGILATATGGDAALRGFATTGANESEAWEKGFWRERA